MFSPALVTDAERTLAMLRAGRLMCATAESCTGGLIAALLTAVPGSSDVVERGFVTYSNRAKMEMLGVPEAVLAAHGAVSAETAEAMARGALAQSGAQVAVAVTGVAGPGGGSPEKPVGLVHLAAIGPGGLCLAERRFGMVGRDRVRELTVIEALAL
ncbi:MAG: CinA family protein, partial [Beijerinckiaceae bacterium]